MLCAQPYMMGSLACGCGRCLPCRINRRRVWTGRLLLESNFHAESSFVTLTYDDENLPADGSLEPGEVGKWVKRLRYAVRPVKIRYFIAGEYGERRERPHYHGIIFGLPPGIGGGVAGDSGVVQETWGFGFTNVGSVTAESCQYVAGYVSKKFVSGCGGELGERVGEFARMSLRPGIGAAAVGYIASNLAGEAGLDYVAEVGDVPRSFRVGSKLYPLGRFLHGKVIDAMGLCREKISESCGRKAAGEVQRLYREDVAAARAEARDVQEYRVARWKQKLLNCSQRFGVMHRLSTSSL